MGCSNNTAKYEAVIVGLELVLQLLVTSLTIYSDSELIVKQLLENQTWDKPGPLSKKAE